MKLRISGKDYDVERALAKVPLGTLYELQVKQKINMRHLAVAARKFQTIDDPTEVLGDPVLLQALLVMIWLARRHAGENVSFEESSAVPLDELELVDDEPEPEDEAGVVDPKPDSGPAAVGGEAKQAKGTKSKTSKSRSTKTSRT